VGGLLTLAGALTYAELGAALPEAGGQYVYLREAYGNMAAFLFGWILFLVYMTGGIAGLALAFAEYFGYFFPSFSTESTLFSQTFHFFGRSLTYSLSAGQLVGVLVIILLSVFNFVGVGLGKFIQNIFTVLKIGIIVTIIGLGTWAFDGWNNVNFVAGEIKKPSRNLPLALIIGTLGITVLYVLTNYIYLYALPIPEVKGFVRIAEKATSALFGSSTGALISAAVIISTFGALNGSILTGPRVYYAMAKDKLFFQRVSQVHPRFRTPGFAILIQALWASLLTLAGTFEQIFTFAMFMAIVFWIAATASVFTLRKKLPDLPRPYKTWGYPVVPALFILASLGILLNTLLEKPAEALAGIILTALGIPVYYYWKRKK